MAKPKYNYFEEFLNASEYALTIAKMLYEILSRFDINNLDENLKKIHKIENEADDSKHKMHNYLVKDFLPPIDREDINLLAHKLDDVIDDIEEILIEIDILDIKKIKSEVIECANLLVECCDAMTQLIKEFENFKKSKTIKDKVVEINRLEEEGDELYTTHMKNLYRNCNDNLEIIKWSKIFTSFEKCFDACETVANNIESIAMKNS